MLSTLLTNFKQFLDIAKLQDILFISTYFLGIEAYLFYSLRKNQSSTLFFIGTLLFDV